MGRGVAAVVGGGAFRGGLLRASDGLLVAAQVDGFGEGQQGVRELGQGHFGEGVPMFGIDRHPHSFVGVAKFVGQRVAGNGRRGLGPVRSASPAASTACSAAAAPHRT